MTCKGGYYVRLDGSHDRLTVASEAACFARADLAGAPSIAVLIAVRSDQFTRKHVLMSRLGSTDENSYQLFHWIQQGSVK